MSEIDAVNDFFIFVKVDFWAKRKCKGKQNFQTMASKLIVEAVYFHDSTEIPERKNTNDLTTGDYLNL